MPGQTCTDDGRCLDGKPLCNDDKDCSEVEVCKDRECVAKCNENKDCKVGESCSIEGKCVPLACEITSDCKTNQICLQGNCVQEPKGKSDM